MAIIGLILRNIFVLYLGASVRYAIHRMFKSKKDFRTILHGIPVKNKTDEMLNFENEMINRLYGIAVLVILVIIIIVITRRPDVVTIKNI